MITCWGDENPEDGKVLGLGKNHKVLADCKKKRSLGQCKGETEEEPAQSKLGRTKLKGTRVVPFSFFP